MVQNLKNVQILTLDFVIFLINIKAISEILQNYSDSKTNKSIERYYVGDMIQMVIFISFVYV